ncbi:MULTISPECIES: AraC family transcriptional regulator [Streptomyces]|nr:MULTISPECIES: AraC family transcriptional regulator [Streptomyces]
MEAGEESVPRFVIRAGYACYLGPSTNSSFHGHAAFQIAIALQGGVTMLDASGTCHRDVALIVPPMVRHRMLAATSLRVFFVDPHCAFADRLRERCGDDVNGITAAPDLSELREEHVRPAGARPSSRIDGRLLAAMDALADRSVPMPRLAEEVGLSPQRLRALARHQLGMPLARWRIWQRLIRAAEALREGQSLADAAITGGFADQAHLNRQMRDMMGLTPSVLRPILLRPIPRPSAATSDVHRDRTEGR